MSKEFDAREFGRPDETWFSKDMRVLVIVWYLFVGIVFFGMVFQSYADRLRMIFISIGFSLP